MTGPTHALIGATAALVVIGTPAAAMVGALGALVPDVDHPGSTLGRRTFGASHIVRWLFGHRGVTHSAVFVALCALSLLWEEKLGMAFVVGVASHVLADMVTPAGVPLLWPVGYRYRLLPSRYWELLAVLLCGAALLWWSSR